MYNTLSWLRANEDNFGDMDDFTVQALVYIAAISLPRTTYSSGDKEANVNNALDWIRNNDSTLQVDLDDFVGHAIANSRNRNAKVKAHLSPEAKGCWRITVVDPTKQCQAVTTGRRNNRSTDPIKQCQAVTTGRRHNRSTG
jgi:hypothetical protein